MWHSVNSIFNPSFVDSLFARTAENRRALLADARATNYGVVRLELIELLYERMYDQRRELGPDERRWPHRIRNATDVVSFVDGDGDGDARQPNQPARLRIRPLGADSTGEDEVLEVDLVIAATGYQRSAHLTMMGDVEALLPDANQPVNGGPAVATAVLGSGATEIEPTESRIGSRPVKVGRDYSVQFAPGKVAAGSGIWLQGCCEGTHGVSLRHHTRLKSVSCKKKKRMLILS